MSVHSYPRFRSFAVTSRLLGNERRLFMLDYLESREACITDLALLLHVSEPTMSKHVHLLLRANLLESERRVGRVYVRMQRSFRPTWRIIKRLLLKE